MTRKPVSTDFEDVYPHNEFAPLVSLAMTVGAHAARRLRARSAHANPTARHSGPGGIRHKAPGT